MCVLVFQLPTMPICRWVVNTYIPHKAQGACATRLEFSFILYQASGEVMFMLLSGSGLFVRKAKH